MAITIDTETFPPEVLLVRGRASVTEVDGIPEEYALAARRYMLTSQGVERRTIQARR